MVQITATKKKGELLCEHKIVLTKSQLEKLESPALCKRIDNLLKDFQLCARGVEDDGNIQLSIVSRTTNEIDDEFLHNMEIAHNNFLSAVEDMELPEEDNDPEGADDELDEGTPLTEKWVQEFLDNLDEDVLGAIVMKRIGSLYPLHIPNGMQLSPSALRELCKAYIKLKKYPSVRHTLN